VTLKISRPTRSNRFLSSLDVFLVCIPGFMVRDVSTLRCLLLLSSHPIPNSAGDPFLFFMLTFRSVCNRYCDLVVYWYEFYKDLFRSDYYLPQSLVRTIAVVVVVFVENN
jgi:hypothetical protein